jgi:hypothetical protein
LVEKDRAEQNVEVLRQPLGQLKTMSEDSGKDD